METSSDSSRCYCDDPSMSECLGKPVGPFAVPPANSWAEETLECTQCHAHVHVKCLLSPTPSELFNDYLFHLVCSRCSGGGEETFTRPRKLQAVHIVSLILHNLHSTQTGQNGFFHYKKDINNLLLQHQIHLLRHSKSKNVCSGTSSALSTYCGHFESGTKYLGEHGWWRLRENKPPFLSHVYPREYVEKGDLTLPLKRARADRKKKKLSDDFVSGKKKKGMETKKASKQKAIIDEEHVDVVSESDSLDTSSSDAILAKSEPVIKQEPYVSDLLVSSYLPIKEETIDNLEFDIPISGLDLDMGLGLAIDTSSLCDEIVIPSESPSMANLSSAFHDSLVKSEQEVSMQIVSSESIAEDVTKEPNDLMNHSNKEEEVNTSCPQLQGLASVTHDQKVEVTSMTQHQKEAVVSTTQHPKEEVASMTQHQKEEVASTTQQQNQEVANKTPQTAPEEANTTPVVANKWSVYKEEQLLRILNDMVAVKSSNLSSEHRLLRRMLLLRKYKRSQGIELFNSNQRKADQRSDNIRLPPRHKAYIPAGLSAPVVQYCDSPLDRYQVAVTSESSSQFVPFINKLKGAPELLRSTKSCYTARTLKPYIWRDFETQPPKLKILNAIRKRSGENTTVCSIDYKYVNSDHIPVINRICHQAFWPSIDLSECLQYSDFSCVAMYKKLIVGFAFMVPDVKHNEAYISFIYTHPDWRGSGIASVMLYHLIQTCMGKDVSLHVSMSNPAIGLYLKFGFKVAEIIHNFYDKYHPIDSSQSPHAFYMKLDRY